MSQMSEMAKCGQINAGKNLRMSKARNERVTPEQQIQPLEGKDIPGFFPALVCPHFAISDICAISPLRS
jgi:CO dehydrogenase/acetyl-CoA synthase beta subunit